MKPKRDWHEWQLWYSALKALEPEAYQKAIRYADGMAMQHKLPTYAAADIERSHIMLACELLGIRPTNTLESGAAGSAARPPRTETERRTVSPVSPFQGKP